MDLEWSVCTVCGRVLSSKHTGWSQWPCGRLVFVRNSGAACPGVMIALSQEHQEMVMAARRLGGDDAAATAAKELAGG